MVRSTGLLSGWMKRTMPLAKYDALCAIETRLKLNSVALAQEEAIEDAPAHRAKNTLRWSAPLEVDNSVSCDCILAGPVEEDAPLSHIRRRLQEPCCPGAVLRRVSGLTWSLDWCCKQRV